MAAKYGYKLDAGNATGRSLRRNVEVRERVSADGDQYRYLDLMKHIARDRRLRRCRKSERPGARIVEEHGTNCRRRGLPEIRLMVDPDRRKPGHTCEVVGLRCCDRRPQRGRAILVRDLNDRGVANVGYGRWLMHGQAVHQLRMLQHHQHDDRTAVGPADKVHRAGVQTANEGGNIVRIRLLRVFRFTIGPWGCPEITHVETDETIMRRDGSTLRIPGAVVCAATVNENHGRAMPLFLIDERDTVDAGLLDLRSTGCSRRPSLADGQQEQTTDQADLRR